jgi:hypothetical protein
MKAKNMLFLTEVQRDNVQMWQADPKNQYHNLFSGCVIEMMKELIERGKVRTCRSSKFSQRDHTGAVLDACKIAGIEADYANDAPRGGANGFYVFLTPSTND